jgi:hypothetical protein
MSDPVYTPNSHKFKEQQKEVAPAEKRVQKVVKSPVKTKTNELRKFADIFISEDVKNVKNYIFMDVLVPAIKKAIYDIVTNGIDMFLYGGTGKGKTSGPSGTKVSYRNFYEQKNGSSSNSGYRGSENTKSHNGFEYEDIIFDNRGDAEAVREQLQAAIVRYGLVTVSDLYDMIDQPAPYTSQKYGWMDLSSAEVARVRGDYVLKLPRPVPID